MNPTKTRSWKSAVAIAALLLTVPAFAQKRRAVQHPSPPDPGMSITVTGKVLDAVTGAPVVFASVQVGNRSDRTDTTGAFQLTTTIYGQADLTVQRSGYTVLTQPISGPGPHALTLRVQPTPTVKLRLVDGTEHDVDNESVEFGYVPPFSSYIKNDHDDFCKPDGTTLVLNRTQFSRITGPATNETAGACCGGTGTPQKINATLKSGEVTPLYFTDSCGGYSIDFIARDHVSGRMIFAKFSNIAEIIFP